MAKFKSQTDSMLLAQRYQKSVDYGSPMTAWTSDMLKAQRGVSSMSNQLSEYDDFMQQEENRTPDFFIAVNTSPAMSGYFATLWGCDEESKKDLDEEFREPYETGMGRYAKREDAVLEAKAWAKELEDTPYIEWA